MLISMPILVGLAILCGIGAGYYVAVHALDVPGVYYWHNTVLYTHDKDIWIGLVKGFFFGLIIICWSAATRGLNRRRARRASAWRRRRRWSIRSSSCSIANFFFTFLLNALL